MRLEIGRRPAEAGVRLRCPGRKGIEWSLDIGTSEALACVCRIGAPMRLSKVGIEAKAKIGLFAGLHGRRGDIDNGAQPTLGPVQMGVTVYDPVVRVPVAIRALYRAFQLHSGIPMILSGRFRIPLRRSPGRGRDGEGRSRCSNENNNGAPSSNSPSPSPSVLLGAEVRNEYLTGLAIRLKSVDVELSSSALRGLPGMGRAARQDESFEEAQGMKTKLHSADRTAARGVDWHMQDENN